jgi:type III secretion protein V
MTARARRQQRQDDGTMAEPKALPRDWQRIFSAGRSVSGRRLGASPRADLFLAGFIVSGVALFILPLPQAALDGMISLNLAASVVLLTVSTYVPSAVSFSSFPALLLFTTLFRVVQADPAARERGPCDRRVRAARGRQ